MYRRRVLKKVGAFFAALTVLLATAVAPALAATTTNSSGTGAGNGMRVSPVHTDLTMTPGTNTTLDVYVTNVTNSKATFEAIINDFTASGDETGNPAVILDPTKSAPSHGLKQYIAPIANFTLNPGEQKDVKAVISIPRNAAPGGYFGAVRFAVANTAPGKNVSLSASVATLVLVKVSGNIAEQMSIASLDARAKDKPHGLFTSNKNIDAVVRFQNEGNVQEQPFGKILVKDIHGKTIGTYDVNNTTPAGNVLPGSIRKFTVPLKGIGKFGKYTLLGNFGYGSGGQLLTAKTTFYVVPIPVIITVLVLIVLILVGIFEVPRLIKRYNQRILRQAGRR